MSQTIVPDILTLCCPATLCAGLRHFPPERQPFRHNEWGVVQRGMSRQS